MSLFEHIMITSSIILGLAIAQLLTGFADALRLKHVRLYWPHTLWALSQLLACIQWGFGVWIYETRQAWYGYELLLFILTPVVGFLIARFMYPHPVESVPLRQHYYETRGLTYGLAAALMAETTLANSLLSYGKLLVVENLLSLLVMSIFITLAVSKKESLHKRLVPLVLLFSLLSAAVTSIFDHKVFDAAASEFLLYWPAFFS